MARTFRNTRLLGVVSAIVAGTSAVTGSAWLYYNKNSLLQAAEQRSESKLSPLESVLASWTTNFKPTVEWDNNWDRRAPTSVVKPSKLDKDEKDHQNELQKVTPTATRHLILIRHGQYNMDGDGDPQRYLTPLGREQAAFTGQRLHALNAQLCKKKGADIKYTKIINSTLTRAIETADIIAACFPQVARQSCDLLCEGAPIPPEPPIGHWRPEPDFFQDGARIEAAFRRYFHRASPKQEEDSYEIIVCHANVIRYFVCRALQLPPEAWLRMALHHGSITWFAIRPSGRVSLRAVGDAGFIPADKLSFN